MGTRQVGYCTVGEITVSMISLVTFSSDEMSRSALLCENSARRHGVTHVTDWRQSELKRTGFYYANRAILDNPRGAGLWLWKPYIILHAMRDLHPSDTLIYVDVGVEFINNTRYIIDRMTQDIWLFGNQYEHAHWCKRDVIDAIWPQPWASFGKQVQASVIFFRVTPYAKKFVEEWLRYCQQEHLIDDSPSARPNHPEFRENRHDQAILTTLAYREGLKLGWWPAMYNDGKFIYERGDYPDTGIPVLFHHHRRRDSEFQSEVAA